MKARKYLDKHGFQGYQGEWFTSIMEEFAKQQNKELIDKLTQCETANTDFQSENRNLIAMSQNLDGKNKNQRRSLKSLIQENKELIEICTKLVDANKREDVIETIEWTDELEDYLLKTNKK